MKRTILAASVLGLGLVAGSVLAGERAYQGQQQQQQHFILARQYTQTQQYQPVQQYGQLVQVQRIQPAQQVRQYCGQQTQVTPVPTTQSQAQQSAPSEVRVQHTQQSWGGVQAGQAW